MNTTFLRSAGAVLRQLLLAAPVRLWALICAGPSLTALAFWLARSIRRGWPAGHEGEQLVILGNALYGVLVLVAIVVVALAGVKVAAETKIGSLTLDGDRDADLDPSPPVEPKA